VTKRAPSNALSPNKLLHTKWTAVEPRNKEKHFLVTKVTINRAPVLTLWAAVAAKLRSVC